MSFGWVEHFPGRVMEVYVTPEHRDASHTAFGELVRTSGATHLVAQTNIRRQLDLLEAFVRGVEAEHLLVGSEAPAGALPRLEVPGASFRARRPDDAGPEGEWVVDVDGEVVAAGGILDHYNPPYGDVYMAVAQPWRRRGLGSYLVRELRRVCVEGGMIPAARCDPDNVASRRTLLRGGFEEVGRLVSGRLA